jgi:tetratricopeptide (TPR) repeat protein
MKTVLFYALLAAAPSSWKNARDAQDRTALDKIVTEAGTQAQAKPNDAEAQYAAALARFYQSEVALELKDKAGARSAAEAGIRFAEKAVALAPKSGENHRILGTLCGQVIPANVLLGMKYGKCALDEVNKAIELEPKSSQAYLSRGVGNYYLPAQFGGGPELAVKDFQKAIELDPKNADAYLWLGVALRKLNRNAEANTAIAHSLKLNPNRLWAKQQLEKTPAN